MPCCLTRVYQVYCVCRSFKHVSRVPALPALLASLSATFQTSRFVSAILQRMIPAAVKQTALDIISSSSSSSYSSEDESDGPGPYLMSVVHDIMAHVTMDTETVTLAAR